MDAGKKLSALALVLGLLLLPGCGRQGEQAQRAGAAYVAARPPAAFFENDVSEAYV